MAVLYLGVNNQAKKVKDFYIGINNQAKKVKKAYIGINNKAKLFYTSSLEITLDFVRDISYIQFSPIVGKYDKWIDNYKKYATYRNGENDDVFQGNNIYINSIVEKVYFNENCIGLFAPLQYEHQDHSIALDEQVFSKLSFDKVKELTAFMYQLRQCGDFNISVLKDFNNVINMQDAFADCTDFYGNPIYAPNAVNMTSSYYFCYNISGTARIGEKVTNAAEAYYQAATGYKKTLNLNYLNVGKYGSINLFNCFAYCNIYGNINIYDTGSNLLYMFRSRSSSKELRIHLPSSVKIQTYSTKIVNSTEKHTYISSATPKYLEIQDSSGVSLGVKIYNDITT